MSRNLVELIRRHHAVQTPTALEVLKEAVADHGELTDAEGAGRRVTAGRARVGEH